MGSSTSIDVNYLSLGGDGLWTLFAGSPVPARTAFPQNGIIEPDNPQQFASCLKFSSAAVTTLTGIRVSQGSECAVDVNNHVNVKLDGIFGTENNTFGDQVISVKGGSVLVISGILKGTGHRLNAEILIDQWSDQSYNGSTVDLTYLNHITGHKIQVVKRYGASTIIGFNYKVLVWMSIKLTAYWWVKWLVRKFCGIKVGQRGPSWI